MKSGDYVDCTKIKRTEEELVYLESPDVLYTGQCKCFNENGNLVLENNYLRGLLHGPSYIWFNNGQIQLESQYINGKRSGTFKTYFENGSIESIVEYGENEIPKYFEVWDKNGKLINSSKK